MVKFCLSQKFIERWAHCVEKLYNEGKISELEVKPVIQKLTQNNATGYENIPAEFLQILGDKRIQSITKLMNNIYSAGTIRVPDDCLQNKYIHYYTKHKPRTRML